MNALLLPSRSPVIFFDLETTGLCARNDRIIELAAIRFVPGEQTHSSMCALIAIDRPIPKFITRLTGITDEMLAREGRPMAEVLTDFVEFVGDHPVVAFNINFDARFLRSELERHGHAAINNQAHCALQVAREAWPDLDSHKLSKLAEYLNLDNGTSHRALDDARLAAEVFFKAHAQYVPPPKAKHQAEQRSLKDESPSTIPIISGSRQFRIEVLGKNAYQDVFERLCGPRFEGCPATDVQAQMRVEVKSSAVKVLFQEEVIGNLAPRIAQDFRRAAVHGNLSEYTHFECAAKIRGGQRCSDGSTRPYEMWLDIPQDDD